MKKGKKKKSSNGRAIPWSQRRKQMEKELISRTEAGYNKKDESGRFRLYFTEDNLPLWQCGEGEHIIDIVPYPAGKNFPKGYKIKKGEASNSLVVWIHPNVGPNMDWYICPNHKYNGK